MDDLKHYGILGMHWGIRRFQPYGKGGYNAKREGKEIGQAAREAARAEKRAKKKAIFDEKNRSVGKARLEERIARANRNEEVDLLASKIGWDNTEASGDAHARVKNIKQVSKEILEDDERLRKLGYRTRDSRATITSSTIAGDIAIGAATIAAMSSTSAVWPLAIGGSAIITLSGIGQKYYRKTFY